MIQKYLSCAAMTIGRNTQLFQALSPQIGYSKLYIILIQCVIDYNTRINISLFSSQL